MPTPCESIWDPEVRWQMYRNAAEILPRGLLEMVQQYVHGQEIYVPRKGRARLGWGEANGTREALDERNDRIYSQYRCGATIDTLTKEHHLSHDSIRKIIKRCRQTVKRRESCFGA